MGGFRHTGAQDPVGAQDYFTKNAHDTATSMGTSPIASATATKINGLQPDLVLAKSAVQVVMPVNAAENTAFTVTVPAGSMGANGSLRVTYVTSSTGATSNFSVRHKFGATTLATFTNSFGAASSVRAESYVANRNATNSQYTTNIISSSIVGGTAAIDTTAATTFVVTIQKLVGADNVNLEWFLAEIMPSA
jgi:hypothetical protein